MSVEASSPAGAQLGEGASGAATPGSRVEAAVGGAF